MTVTSVFPNDAKIYGQEIRTDTPIQQTVDGEVQNYKVFYKKEPNEEVGTTVILPVDDSGKVLPQAEPIYKDGVWDSSKITEKEFESYGRGSTRQSNVTITNLEKLNTNPPTFTGKINDNIKQKVTGHAEAVGHKRPEFTKKSTYSTDLEREINRLQIRAENSGGRQQVALWSRIKRLQKKLDNENKLLLPGGATGAIVRGSSNYDSSDDVMFATAVSYPMDMSDQQDRFSITCYSYQAPYATSFASKNVGSAYGAQRSSPYRKKIGAGIYLPMPNNMIDGNSRKWEEDNINLQALEAIRASSNFGIANIVMSKLGLGRFTGFVRNAVNTSRSLSQQAGRQELMANEISQLVGEMGYDVSADTILSRSAGVIANANTELLFAGVSLRSFEFNWVMSPRDRREAAQVRMIIRALKQWSAPRKLKKLVSGKTGTEAGGTGQAGGPSYFLGTPNIFRLRYLTSGGRDILGVNKFKPCALTDININYTPEGMWMAYEGGQPISVQMSLKFNELEPIYNTDYSSDIAKGRAFDSGDPESTGDLMPISVIRQDSPYTADVGY